MFLFEKHTFEIVTMSSLAQADTSYQKVLDFFYLLNNHKDTSGKVFKNLFDFRDTYDDNSALTQMAIGVIGASGLFQSPEEAKEFYDSPPKFGEFGKPVLLLRPRPVLRPLPGCRPQ